MNFDEPDEVLWELSDPNLDYDSIEESAYHSRQEGIYENVWGQKRDYDKNPLKEEIDSDDFYYFDENGEKLQSIALYHEDLKRYQQSLAKSSGETKPSEAQRVYWIYAESTNKYKKPTEYSGKWMCFIPEKYIDAAWAQIKDATERGLLGGKSKVSTLKGKRGDDYVCCVYTYNWKDETDVMRVREELRELGFTKAIPYKTDADTLAKKYAHKGDKGIAKYFE